MLAHNDQLAIGIMRGLRTRGVQVPEDVSVVGFDNIGAAELVTPGLATIAAPLHAGGVAATRPLLVMVGGAPGPTGAPVVLPARLVVRVPTAQRATGTGGSSASQSSTSPASCPGTCSCGVCPTPGSSR